LINRSGIFEEIIRQSADNTANPFWHDHSKRDRDFADCRLRPAERPRLLRSSSVLPRSALCCRLVSGCWNMQKAS